MAILQLWQWHLQERHSELVESLLSRYCVLCYLYVHLFWIGDPSWPALISVQLKKSPISSRRFGRRRSRAVTWFSGSSRHGTLPQHLHQ